MIEVPTKAERDEAADRIVEGHQSDEQLVEGFVEAIRLSLSDAGYTEAIILTLTPFIREGAWAHVKDVIRPLIGGADV